MFPFLLSSNENENHNENDSHFGPLRGRHHFSTSLSHFGAGNALKKISVWHWRSKLRQFWCVSAVTHPYSPMRMIIIRI